MIQTNAARSQHEQLYKNHCTPEGHIMDATPAPDPFDAAQFAVWLRAVIEQHAPRGSVYLVEVHLPGRRKPIRQLVGKPQGLCERQLAMLAALALASGPIRGKELAKRLDEKFTGAFREDLAQLRFLKLIDPTPGGYRLPRETPPDFV